MFTITLTLLVAIIAAGALYFVSVENRDRSTGEYVTSHPLRKYVALPFLLVVAVVLFESFTVVPGGHVGVQVTLGKINPESLPEGAQLVNPISSVRNVDVRLQRAELKGANAGTKDLQQVHTDIVVGYRLSGTKVPHIFKEFGLDVDNKVLGPAINEAFKAVTAKYNSEELITKRDEVSLAITQHITAKVAQFDITVANVSLVNFGFSAEYQKAIEAKVIATQSKLKAEQDLQRIEVEAKSRIAQAEGEAKAISIQAQAIQSNGGAQYVQLQWIEKWDGKMPTTVVGADSKTLMNIGK
jgi:regulator of protease activity HflC (stomatin/prohibitin superfamily)